jgi:hypothetical protein
MKRRPALALAALASCGAVAVLSTGRASDHLDGPRVTADPPSDITDVFAFTSPGDASRVVFAMALTPYASASARFASGVDYVFRIRRVTAPSPLTLDPSVLDVACDFDDGGVQTVHCTAPGGLSARALVGAVGDADAGAAPSMRVFAGLRSDPAFFDRQGALATVAADRTSFTGQNAFAGANVLAIVVEIDSRAAFAASDAGLDAPSGTEAGGDAGALSGLPILAVAAETERNAL